ncbi:MAG: hypothetical protein RL034_524 [Bacteroidota bacterium]|jgi:Protein of unknown function (DUF2480)
MADPIINKVEESGLISLDLEKYYPGHPIHVFDLKDYLFMGLILKEKDFRAALTATDWTQYQNASVAITCSADAIVPMWAYMLVASALEPFASVVFFGTEEQLKEKLLLQNIDTINAADYTDKRVVVKGCGDIQIPAAAYVSITNKLRPVAKSIMFGEPCSTVPIYKKK